MAVRTTSPGLPTLTHSETARRLRSALRPLAAGFLECLEGRRLFCADHPASEAATDIFIDPTDQVTIAAIERSITDGSIGNSSNTAARSATGDATGIPVLHSLPGAPAAIYLDFDGAGSFGGYDDDGDPNSFNAAEQAVVTRAWTSTAAYYAMFNIDVMTGPDLPTVPFAWQLNGNGIVGAYSSVGTFPNSEAESFNNSGSARSRNSAIAHETGHNFGMQHQSEFDSLGNETAAYTDGFDRQHGAIMGTDYARVVRKWFIGHDTTADGAYTLQDDLQIIANDLDNLGSAALGTADGYRADLHGGTIAAATPLTASGVNQTISAVIERRADVDTFSFTSTGGRYLVAAARFGESAVDLKIEVRNAANGLLATEDLTLSNEADVSLDLPAGTYYLSVAGHGNYGDLGMYDVQVSPIANGFDSSEVTLARRAGSTTYNPATGAWTLVAGGRPEIDSTSGNTTTTFDQLRYAYTPLRGDGTIIARVSSTAVNTGAFAGVMIRESLADTSRFAMANLATGTTVNFTRRAAAGAAHAITSATGVSGPYWLRLQRVGDTFTASRSTNGTTWTAVGSATTIAMGTDVYVGLAATSFSELSTITATFNDVGITGDTGEKTYASNGLVAPASVAVALGVGSGLSVAWDAVVDATGYVVERSRDGVNFVQAGLAGATSYTDANLEGSYRYFYRVWATNAVAGARSLVSAVASATNRPSAVTVSTMSVGQSRIVVDWRDTVGETGFRVERSVDGGTNWSPLGTVGVNVPSYTDASVSTGNVYRYRVTPLSPLGDGVTSSVAIEQARLLVVNGVQVDSITSSTAVLSWTDLNAGETGYKIERSTDLESWTTAGSVGADVTTFTNAGLTSVTGYYWRVQGTTTETESAYDATPAFAATPAINALPAPWQRADVGAAGTLPPRSSASGQVSGTYTIVNSSDDIGGTDDAFTYIQQQLTGDVSITANVTSITDAPVGAEVGLMFRTSLDPGSPYAMAIITNNSDSRINWRTSSGGTTSSTNGPNKSNGDNVDAPYWLRLARVGNLITASQSPDNVTWTTIGTATFALGATIYVGMAASSHSLTGMTIAKFAGVSTTGTLVVADTTPPAAPVFGSISNDSGASSGDRITSDATLTLSGTAEANSTVTLSRLGSVIGMAIANGSGAWGFDYTGVTLADGPHTFTATARDAAGNVSAPASMTVTVDATAPTVQAAAFSREVGHHFTVTFSESILGTLAPGDVRIVQIGETGPGVAASVTGYDTTTHTLSLAMPNFALLADGRYELRVLEGGLGDVAGNAVAAYALPFRVLTGDANADGVVGFDDLLALAQNYGATSGRTYSQGNLNYDATGAVDFDDLLLLAQNYGAGDALAAARTLATPAKPTTPATRRKPATFGSAAIV